MENRIKTIGVLTSGGDAPGMNAAIRAVVRAGRSQGLIVKGIKQGYAGLLAGDIRDMDTHSVSDTIGAGGTILYTARSKEFMSLEGQVEGAKILRRNHIDALVVIGGDGSYRGALQLARQGIQVIGIPATIDLDIASTDYTIGYDTAVNTAMEAIDKIRDTSSSHERCSIIEVMGRSAGYIAIATGMATGVEDILLPETYDGDREKIVAHVKKSLQYGKRHHLVVVAEGIGHSEELARYIEQETGMETRATILGYLQRGGSPSCRDRMMATMMGVHAVDLLLNQEGSRVVAYRGGKMTDFDIAEAVEMQKQLPPAWERAAKLTEHQYE